MKKFEVYVFNKNFTVRNAGGLPPPYMFSGKDPIGDIFEIEGTDKEDVYNYAVEHLNPEIKDLVEVIVGREL